MKRDGRFVTPHAIVETAAELRSLLPGIGALKDLVLQARAQGGSFLWVRDRYTPPTQATQAQVSVTNTHLRVNFRQPWGYFCTYQIALSRIKGN